MTRKYTKSNGAKTSGTPPVLVLEKPADPTLDISVEIDLDNMSIGDLELVELWENGEDFRWKDVINFLERICITETPIRALKIRQLNQLVEAVQKSLASQMAAKN